MLTIPFMQQRVYNPHRPGFMQILIYNLHGMGGWPKGEIWFPNNQLPTGPSLTITQAD